METTPRTVITIETLVNAPVEKAWETWTTPDHITKWAGASPEWHTPRYENDLRTGGGFKSRMEARDGSMGFDFNGTYDEVRDHEYIEYSLEDGRKVKTTFTPQGNQTRVVQQFEAEKTNPIEMQKNGWQAILDNFRSYTESN